MMIEPKAYGGKLFDLQYHECYELESMGAINRLLRTKLKVPKSMYPVLH